jgi:hypothetical protein
MSQPDMGPKLGIRGQHTERNRYNFTEDFATSESVKYRSVAWSLAGYFSSNPVSPNPTKTYQFIVAGDADCKVYTSSVSANL